MRFYRGLQPFKVMSFDLDDTLYDNSDVIRLAELPAKFLFRGHHLTEKLLASLDLGVQVVSSEIDTNELLPLVAKASASAAAQ